jgi:hypothetical protein
MPGPERSVKGRVARFDWATVERCLDKQGYAILPAILSAEECRAASDLYQSGEGFRSRIVMARHNFGSGEYKYFDYPLPPLVGELRAALYPRLALIANQWGAALGSEKSCPADHASYLTQCHTAGQTRATPLLLKYGAGDYNCLHQDLYGELVFPLQVAVLLSQPGEEFSGGEFILTEQRPRMQSRVEVVPLARGDGVVFPVHHRPVKGKRGIYRATLRHGVSRIRTGNRYTLGVIFHDAG